MPSLKAIVYGLICAIIVFFIGNILTELLDLKPIITELSSIVGLLIPPFVEVLANKKKETDTKLLSEIEQNINDIYKCINELENEIIEIRAVLSCYPLQKMDDTIHELRTKITILESHKKSL